MFLLVIFILTLGTVLGAQVSNESNVVHKGDYPYMAYIYYKNIQIKDRNHARFFRAGVLVTPEHVVSASVDPLGVAAASPHRALLARLGAVAVDSSKFKLHEGEQEREVTQIMRPNNHSVETWWMTDITVLKVQEPFTVSELIAPTQLAISSDRYSEKLCSVIAFAKKDKHSHQMLLQRVAVKVLANKSCGESNFQADRMICSSGHTQGNKSCLVNSGSPLLCEDQIVALQSVTKDSKCKPPHKYQLLLFWKNFLNCSIQSECSSKNCESICFSTDIIKYEKKALKEIKPVFLPENKTISPKNISTATDEYNDEISNSPNETKNEKQISTTSEISDTSQEEFLMAVSIPETKIKHVEDEDDIRENKKKANKDETISKTIDLHLLTDYPKDKAEQVLDEILNKVADRVEMVNDAGGESTDVTVTDLQLLQENLKARSANSSTMKEPYRLFVIIFQLHFVMLFLKYLV